MDLLASASILIKVAVNYATKKKPETLQKYMQVEPKIKLIQSFKFLSQLS